MSGILRQMKDNGLSTASFYNDNIQNNYLLGSGIPQSNDDITKQIVESGNQTIAGLNNINLGLISNINQEILVKKDELIKMQNNDLTQQLRNLETIQSNIENKNVIINQINYNMSVQQKNIMILIVSILFGLLLLGNIIAHGYGYISYSRYIYIIIGLIILYICFIIYQFDIFYVKSALTAIFNRNLPQRLDKSVTDLQNYIKDNIEEDIYGNKSHWINENCDCPAEETASISFSQTPFEEDPGYFYYDGSAPSQILVPTPDTVKMNHESINWVDYDKLQEGSHNYYNYNNNHRDPSITLRNQLNSNYNLFVADETWTTNL
jgi:hypothetical protein